MSKKLQKYTQRVRIALALAIGLTILSTVATPLLSDQLADFIGPTQVFANETSGSGG